YVGGILEMMNHRLYEFWGNLEEGLRTGNPQNELKDGGETIFEKLYEEPARLEEFMEAMAGVSKGNFQAFAESFDFSDYETVCDVGGALANLSRLVAREHPHLSFVSMDLPEVTELARERIQEDGLADRIEAVSRDYYEDPIPEADVVTASLILHDISLEDKKMLIDKIYDAVNPGGAFVAIDNIIDDERRDNVFGLLMSLNMLIETGDEGFDYTGEQFTDWATEAGFDKVEIRHLNGPASMAIAHKH
ncbi:MAG: methyltransferase, partial [Bradymonadaceae bacterium]